jgi:hypothetical protein
MASTASVSSNRNLQEVEARQLVDKYGSEAVGRS